MARGEVLGPSQAQGELWEQALFVPGLWLAQLAWSCCSLTCQAKYLQVGMACRVDFQLQSIKNCAVGF